MNTLAAYLPWFLQAAAIGQAAIAVINFFLVRILDWRKDVERMPLLVREVFHVHGWFISLTLALFAVITFRFAQQLASGDPLGSWLAAGIGLFWAIRTVMQVTYYSSSHWRGRTDRTIIHVILLLTYAGFAAVYFCAALGLAR
ncbi:MAG TPA: hypothetical protein VEK08_20295 [Planctomycetota bacterium]|nr:hypothetical protein [Planctomycetota bacterium]